MVRPLEYVSGDLHEMSDADLERITYNLRVAYAAQLNAGGDGSISVGSTQTSIGSSDDTSSTQQSASTTRIVNDGIIQTYPAYPGLGTETDASFAYQQDQTYPGFPSTATLDASGYVFFDTGGGEIVRSANTATQFYDEIISACITEMRTGDEVGTYRIATSTPTDGGAGTWTSKGTWFTDTTYSDGSTTYNLYLKTDLTSVPGTAVEPVGLDGSNLKERAITDTDDLIQNVLLPVLTRRMANGDLLYTVVTSTPSGVNRGSWTDTKQTTASNTQSFSDPTYTSTSTPSGSATVQTTYYLNLA